jgi:hypothetical protein
MEAMRSDYQIIQQISLIVILTFNSLMVIIGINAKNLDRQKSSLYELLK